jgi:hypothetical protein
MSLDDVGRPSSISQLKKPVDDQVEQAQRHVRDHACSVERRSSQVTGSGRLLEPHRLGKPPRSTTSVVAEWCLASVPAGLSASTRCSATSWATFRRALPGFAERLEVITRLLHSDGPVSYTGRFFSLRDAVLYCCHDQAGVEGRRSWWAVAGPHGRFP